MAEKIVTRFAPSPTGTLHVGGMRTAIFNYLFARKHNGKFRLRIEDTDRNRSTEAMNKQIIEGLKWLGIEWDKEIVFQGKNSSHHRALADKLIEKGYAYRCFCSREILEKKREQTEYRNLTYSYDGTCRNLSQQEIALLLNKETAFAIRFKVPAGQTEWNDLVRGKIRVANKELDDFILIRTNGTPTYQMAVVADDNAMEITHVIRGDDHISNTPKQILIFRALEQTIPRYAHVPLILGSDNKRLSKRHGAVAIEAYKHLGIDPDALFNFLARLGWTPKDQQEIMSRSEILKHFSMDEISKKSAVFDEKKLEWMNAQYLSSKSNEELFDQVSDLWRKAGLLQKENINYNKEKILLIISLLKIRAHYLQDFIESSKYFFIDPDDYEEKGISKYLKSDKIWKMLEFSLNRLQETEPFTVNKIEQTVRGIADDFNLTAGKLIHPIRLALTGKTSSPGLFEVMELLGKELVVKRLRNFLEQKTAFQQKILQFGSNL